MGFSVGRCSFDGNIPSSNTSYGTVRVLHNGTVKITGSSGIKRVWTGTGNVYVIFGRPEDVGKHEFRVTGDVETCNAF